jgi:LPXTG-motif cell wall-anchored protein
VIAMAITFVTGLLLLGSTALAADPPGNNGTVKVDAEPFDDAPNNEPHVGCRFQIDFYGYDEGDLNATVTFTAHPPTLPNSGDRVVLKEDTVFIGEDSNAGGGSLAGLDASRTYELDFGDITPHPKQGFHVYLTINAEGSQGSDVKHKVFWSKGCKEVTPPSSSSSTSSSSTTSTTMAGGGGGGVSSSSETTAAPGGSAPEESEQAAKSSLAQTGSNALPMLVAGLALLALGALSVLVSRARRQSGA